MKFVTGLFATFLLFSLNSWADFKSLSLDHLQKLSRARQNQYFDEWRNILLQMEKRQAADARSTSLFLRMILEEAYAAPGDTCNYAGYLSTRNASDRCTKPAPREWPFVSTTGRSITQSFCTGSGQTLCNPLVFGFGPDGTGICTTSRSYPTQDCDRQYRAIPNYGGAEIASQLKGLGLAEAFQDEAQKMADYCVTPQATQKKLCEYNTNRRTYLSNKLGVAPPKVATPPLDAGGVDAGSSSDPRPQGGTDSGPTANTRSGTPTAAPETAPAKPAEKAAPKADDKPKLSTDGCIRHRADFEALRDKLDPRLRSIDKHPLYLGAKTSLVTAALQLRFVGDRIKIASYVWPPTSLGYKIMISDSYINRICLNGNTIEIFAEGQSKPTTAAITGTGADVKTAISDKSVSFSFTDARQFQSIANEVQAAQGGRQ